MFTCSFGCCWSPALSCSGLPTFGRRGSARGAGSYFLSLKNGGAGGAPLVITTPLPVRSPDRLGCLVEPRGEPMKRRSKLSGKTGKAHGPNKAKLKRVSVQNQTAHPVSSSVGSRAEVSRFPRDLNEAREQLAASSEVLHAISSSHGELKPIFQSMLKHATRLCEAKFGNLYRWDNGAFQLVATHNTPRALVEARLRSPPRPNPKNLFGRHHVGESRSALRRHVWNYLPLGRRRIAPYCDA
jgi:hypothetical protein